MGGNASLEEKVLEYWFTLEFLGQDKYPQKELMDALDGVKNLKAKISKGQKGYKSAFDFFELRPQSNLYESIRQEAEQCHMKKWGNITVYIGSVRRESCIKCIAKKLPFENEKDERPELSSDNIACASLQLTPEGKYIEHSFSLSTIVWAMRQVNNCKERVADCLDEAMYQSKITQMEDTFFDEKSVQKLSDMDGGSNQENKTHDKDSSESDSSQSMQEFHPDAVTVTVLEKIYSHIEREYLRNHVEQINGECPYKLVIGISFQMFADEDTRNKEEDDSYLGLSHDYFSDDLKMILNKVRSGDKNIPEYVLDYISSTYESIKDPDGKKRIDLIKPSDKELFESQVQEILNVRNAPIGKWPSKFMPAFMQQMSINLAVKKGSSPLFRESGEVFSVNGPPGTGKTTLLKEIVVNNIIERANLLAKYDNPEDAFDTHNFLRGSKQNNAYSQYTQHWYSLKDDRINDYSILVTSCNNAAVENISKELPLGSGILKDLTPSEDDLDDVKAALNEINELFDFSKSLDTETYGNKTYENKTYENKTVEYPDIYFTYYAQKLLGEKNAWGLIAASLGRKKNIRDFYRSVLSPLKWDFYRPKEQVANRIPRYQAAKEKFLAQEKRVREMQEQIAHICDLAYSKAERQREIPQLEETYRNNLLAGESRKCEIAKSIQKIQTEIMIKTDECTRVLAERNALNDKNAILLSQKQEGEKRVTALRQEAFQIINSVGKKPLLFGKAAYEQKLRYAQKAAADYDRQAEEQSVKNKELSYELERVTRECNMTMPKLAAIEEKRIGLNNEMKKLNTKAAEIDRGLKNQEQVLEASKKALEKIISEYRVSLKDVSDGKILDTEFINELLSEDNDASTEAQVANPWFTARYNREREKLFYYAMKMNKEFVLSSKKCRDNFTTLAHYWGLQPGDDKENLVFHKEDRERCVGALYQTLFLLVPVISTTFASVGTFLRDVKESKVIGTLIVDEAGQAQPQMAVGALYRSRKAVIVGDPKQVEPVVTDDLKLLKKAFDDEKLKPYTTSKTISVQSCADEMNAFGTYLENPEHPDFPDWVGSPLLVHRRCISPMYEISNAISYHGIMKQKTRQPDAGLERTFIYEKSQWIQVKGREKGNKDHFVAAQAQKVCEMLEIAFSRSEFPSLYLISPFTTVVSGIRSHIKRYKKGNQTSSLAKSHKFDTWISSNIGTVHTFQGKEANEVIFLLGCDGSKDAEGAVRWVNSNIVNVAATRAKFRLYVVGDETVWSANNNLQMAKNIMDTFAIKEIHSILMEEKMDDSSKVNALNMAVQGLPPAMAFSFEDMEENSAAIDYSIYTDGFVSGLETYSFMNTPFTAEQLREFGFSSQEDIQKLNPRIRKNLQMGMRLYYFLQPIYAINQDFDASCCAILFCKAMELQMKECFIEGMKEVLSEFVINGKGKGRKQVKLKDARKDEMTLGTFQYVIDKNSSALGQYMKNINQTKHDRKWWSEFGKKLSDCTHKRNDCCHDGLFKWNHLLQLLAEMFQESENELKLEGLMFESEVGRRLKK